MKNNTYVVLPSYNEAPNIAALVSGLRGLGIDGLNIVVVDDGSTDSTFAAASSLAGPDLTVLSHPVNFGLGAALKTGLENVLTRASAGDVIVTMDSDGSHPAESVPSLLAAVAAGADVAICSRFEGGAEVGVPGWRKIMSHSASSIIRILFGYEVKDYSSGYRAYSVGAVRALRNKLGAGEYLAHRDFSCMAELLLKLLYSGAKVVEVPLVLRYDLKKGKSKMRLSRTLRGYLGLFLTLGLRNLKNRFQER